MLNSERYIISKNILIDFRNCTIRGIFGGRFLDNENTYGHCTEIISKVNGTLFTVTNSCFSIEGIRTAYIPDDYYDNTKVGTLNNKTAIYFGDIRCKYGINSCFIDLDKSHNSILKNIQIENYNYGIRNINMINDLTSDFAIFDNVNFFYCKVAFDSIDMNQGSFYNGQYLCCDTAIKCGGHQRFINIQIVKCGSYIDTPVHVLKGNVTFEAPWLEDQNNRDKVQYFFEIGNDGTINYVTSFNITKGSLILVSSTNYVFNIGRAYGNNIELLGNGSPSIPINKLFYFSKGAFRGVKLTLANEIIHDHDYYDVMEGEPKPTFVTEILSGYNTPHVIEGDWKLSKNNGDIFHGKLLNDVGLVNGNNIIKFNKIVENSNSNYDINTGVYTCKDSGYYLIGCQSIIHGIRTSSTVGISLNGENGIYNAFGSDNVSTEIDMNYSGSIVKKLSKGNTIIFKTNVSTTGTPFLKRDYTEFIIIKLPYYI